MFNRLLGLALQEKGRLDEAIAEYRKAIQLDPKDAKSHGNLGAALRDKGRLDESIDECFRSIELDPKLAYAHSNLGGALSAKGRLDEAIAEYRKAIQLDPKYAEAHYGLGIDLQGMGRLDESIAEYHKATQLDPKHAKAHVNLGNALRAKGRLDEAIAEYHNATQLDPKLAAAHCNLGLALSNKGRLDAAVAEYRKAIQLDPKLADAHAALGQALLQQGQFAAARSSLQCCLELLPANHPLQQFAHQQLRQCERMLALDQKLAAILKGQAQPSDATEQLGLAHLCMLKKRYTATVCFFADAFAAQPKLANDMKAENRYNAACAAALAAAGQGEDAAKLDDKERARLRRQALEWLRADLTLWGKQVEKGTGQEREAARKTLRHWQRDADLASLRDTAAVDKLPEKQRADCRKLWDEVAALLKK